MLAMVASQMWFIVLTALAAQSSEGTIISPSALHSSAALAGSSALGFKWPLPHEIKVPKAESKSRQQTDQARYPNWRESIFSIGCSSLALAAMAIAAPLFVVFTEGWGKFAVCFIDSTTEYVKEKVEELRTAFRTDDSGNNVLGQKAQRILFFVASMDAFRTIVTDTPSRSTSDNFFEKATNELVVSLWSVSPRLLFVAGAIARALQLCTNLQYAFNPSVGVAALINFGAMWVDARWLSRVVVGWTITPRLWRICGARPPLRKSETNKIAPEDEVKRLLWSVAREERP